MSEEEKPYPAPTASSVLKAGNTAVITGASSGIGKATCLELASRGMHVWMIDIDKEDLEVAAQMVMKTTTGGSSCSIEYRVVDVSDASAMEQLAQEVFTTHKKQCHFLMNNAGIGLGGNSMTDISMVQKVMNVNTYGPIHGCLAFVNKMKQSKEPGIIVNTGSKQGITMPPGNLTYNMSKAALKVYTEGLEHELMLERRSGTCLLRAALLVPGWVNTSIVLKTMRSHAEHNKKEEETTVFDITTVPFHEEKPAKGAWMPKQIVEFMIQHLEKDDAFYIICPDNDVDRETDNLRMTWTMQDITMDRPPLSRWHPDYKDKFTEFVTANKK